MNLKKTGCSHNTLFGFARVSTQKQVPRDSLSKQEQKLVDYGARKKNFFSTVETGEQEGKKNQGVKIERRGLTKTQIQMSAPLQSLPSNSIFLIGKSNRFSRDYHWVVEVINGFYKEGNKILMEKLFQN